MAIPLPKFALEDGLDVRQLLTRGSVLNINECYDHESDDHLDPIKEDSKNVDFLGEPVKDFTVLAEKLSNIDENGFVKKFVVEEGGGMSLDESFTVSIAFSGYFENENEPFDVVSLRKPLQVDLKDHGLLPGLDIAIKSMLVGEVSIYLFSHQVMYGEYGIPPRIKPRAQCVFFIKLIKSVITSKKGRINFSEPNIFDRVLKEARLLYSSGILLFKTCNYTQAIKTFKRAEFMLHKCRMADEEEEKVQEKLLKKLYTNLAVCYNKVKQPYKTCIACNELARLGALWNNGKALFHNAKALRMIGVYDKAEKRLKRALKLFPNKGEMKAEMELLIKTRDACNQAKIITNDILKSNKGMVSEDFKREVDSLIENFKENINLSKLTLPENLSTQEMAYVKEACIKYNLFFSKVPKDVLDAAIGDGNERAFESTFALDKEDAQSSIDGSCLDREHFQSSTDGIVDREDIQSSTDGFATVSVDIQSSTDGIAKDREEIQSSTDRIVDREDIQSSTDGFATFSVDIQSSTDGIVKDREEIQSSTDRIVDREEIQSSTDRIVDREDIQSSTDGFATEREEIQSSTDRISIDKK